MPTPRRSDEYCRRVLAAFKKANGVKVEAAKIMGININTYRSAYDDAVSRLPDDKSRDQIDIRRDHAREVLQRRRIDELEKQAAANRTIREALFGLKENPLQPPDWPPASGNPKAAKKRESIVLFLSDIHMGEVVSLSAMGGRNSYNMKIAASRLQRYFQTVIKLGTEHWTGLSPDCIYLVLGGDLVSGEIHDELSKTNDLQSIPAVRALAEALAGGLQLLRVAFPSIPLHVISVPGNHGRTTKKPESKAFALNSYDTLVALLLEWWASTAGIKNISFSAPLSGDAYVNIHGWRILFTHGDRIGSRGGSGFVGPAATAARGMQRIIQDYLAEGRIVDLIVMGHFHTDLELEWGFVNGSLVGPSEYSRSGRMRSHPASQWMLTVHPTYGIARRWKIQVGDKSEGAIYEGRTA